MFVKTSQRPPVHAQRPVPLFCILRPIFPQCKVGHCFCRPLLPRRGSCVTHGVPHWLTAPVGMSVGAENACHLGVCAEEAIGSVPARGGWWPVCTRAAVR